MAVPNEPLAWVNDLARRHDAELPELRELDSLYEGTAPLHYIHPEILRETDNRLQAASLGWPMLAVEPLEERLDFLGFQYPEDDSDPSASPAEVASRADQNLARVWQDNDLDEEAQLGRLDALVMRRSYFTVGTNEDDADTPLVTVESPLEMYADINPRNRKVRAALRRWQEHYDSLVRLPERFATLYLPDVTIWYDRGPDGWRETDRDTHDVGDVLVTPVTNRSRLAGRYGRSELTPQLLSLANMANKIASDMGVGAEFHAVPLRALLNIGEDDLVDEKGNKQSALQVIMGRLLTLEGAAGTDVKPFEFSASSLSNFHDSLTQLAKHATALAGLPPTAFGVVTDTPASAEAWRAAEARLVKRAERRIGGFSGPYERVGRQIRRLQDGDWDPSAKRLESRWQDPATPTRAQAVDAARKLIGGDTPIVPLRQVREDLRYTPGQIRRMEAEDEAAARRDPVGQLVRQSVNDMAGGGPVDPVPADVG